MNDEEIIKELSQDITDLYWKSLNGLRDVDKPVCIKNLIIKGMQKARADERQKIIDSLTYDNFRNFGFSVSAILQLYDEDDGTSVIVEILEELKKQLAEQSEDKTK